MTFACRTFQGMGGSSGLPGTVSFSGVTTTNVGSTTGLRAGSFTLVNNGTVNLSNSTGATSWFTPTTTAIGTSVWARLTVNSSLTTISGSATGSWVQLTSNAGWTFTNSATNTEGTGTWTCDFATDSLGSNIIGSGSGSWDVGYTP